MKYKFLRRLFASCSAEGAEMFVSGENFQELYEYTEDTRREDSAFTKVVESTGLDSGGKGKLESACCNTCDAHEMQGFINGFRIGVLLANEVRFGGGKEESA